MIYNNTGKKETKYSTLLRIETLFKKPKRHQNFSLVLFSRISLKDTYAWIRKDTIEIVVSLSQKHLSKNV